MVEAPEHARFCVDLRGEILARFEGGGANPRHEAGAEAHVQEVLRGVVRAAGCSFHQVAYVVAGIAGLDDEADLEWAERLSSSTPLSDTSVSRGWKSFVPWLKLTTNVRRWRRTGSTATLPQRSPRQQVALARALEV